MPRDREQFGRYRVGRRRLIPRRRWPRRILIAANVVVALCLLSVAGAYGYVRYRLSQIRTQPAPHLTKSPGAGSPENILLIGNQSRSCFLTQDRNQAKNFVPAGGSAADLTGSLSDVIMILYLNPSNRTGSILSIPRDTFAPVPPGSGGSIPYQKIDAALNAGKEGPDKLIEAITDDFGIPINHFVELDFCGFEAIVNAIGGIKVDFPEKLYDAYSDLNVQSTGCQTVDGVEALAMVRSRHLQYDPPGDNSPRRDWPNDPESDLARIVRDHEFLRILFSTAISDGLGNPVKANDLLGAAIGDMTIDPGLKGQLISLALRYSHLSPASIPETTLPITTVNSYKYDGYNIGDVDFPVQPLDSQVIARWDSSALPDPSEPALVDVYNMAGTYDLATRTAAALSAGGLHTEVGGDLPPPASQTETFVAYPSGGLAQAVAVASHLGGAIMLDPDSSLHAGTIQVDAGSLLKVLPAASPEPGSPAPTGSSPAPSTVAPPPTAIGQTTTTLAVPTPNGETPSSSIDHLTPYDPRACPAKP